MNNKEDWKEEFDRIFVEGRDYEGDQIIYGTSDKIKDFISSLLESQAKEWFECQQEAVQDERFRIGSKVGFLRQWLNEDRIKNVDKMVTNKDIFAWLEIEERGINE